MGVLSAKGKWVFLAGAAVVTSLARPAPGGFDQQGHHLVGVDGGFAFQVGRTTVVDAVSGATTSNDTKTYRQPAGVISPFVDLGFRAAGPGTFGTRLYADLSWPGPFYGFVLMPRYRLKIDLDGPSLRSVDPWLGIGIAFQFKDEIAHEPYLGFPLALGCDFQLWTTGFYVTSQLGISMVNPLGPSWTEHTEGGVRQLESHYNNFTFKVGLAYQLL